MRRTNISICTGNWFERPSLTITFEKGTRPSMMVSEGIRMLRQLELDKQDHYNQMMNRYEDEEHNNQTKEPYQTKAS